MSPTRLREVAVRVGAGVVFSVGLSLATVGVAGGAASAAPGGSVPVLKPGLSNTGSCTAVFGKPDGMAGAPSGGDIRPGGPVSVDVVWGSGWESAGTVEVLGCTALDGTFVDRLSTRVPRADNNGRFVHTFTVPAEAAPGARLCQQGAVIGLSATRQPQIERVDARCFTVAAPDPAAVPPAPMAAATNPTTTSTTGHGESRTAAAVSEPEPGPAAAAPPEAPAPVQAQAPAASNLPRTGAADRLTTVAAGLLLVLGGGAIALGRSRRRSSTTS